MKSRNKRPTKKEIGRYDRWVAYLRNTNLTEAQINERASRLTEQGRDPEF